MEEYLVHSTYEMIYSFLTFLKRYKAHILFRFQLTLINLEILLITLVYKIKQVIDSYKQFTCTNIRNARIRILFKW